MTTEYKWVNPPYKITFDEYNLSGELEQQCLYFPDIIECAGSLLVLCLILKRKLQNLHIYKDDKEISFDDFVDEFKNYPKRR